MTYFFPSIEFLEEVASITPEYMHRDTTPYAIVSEGFLPPEECDEIVGVMSKEEPYILEACGANTREAPRPLHPCFSSVLAFAQLMNSHVWKYDIDLQAAAWMQTYEVGQEYQMHPDAVVGQVRKLSTIVMLSDPDDYIGGDLYIHGYPERLKVPQTRGTIVTFQPWLLHEVTEILEGTRRTINLGFWGPPFR